MIKSCYSLISSGTELNKLKVIRFSNQSLINKFLQSKDIREVFDEADQNTEHPITTVSSDALNGTQMATKSVMNKSQISIKLRII